QRLYHRHLFTDCLMRAQDDTVRLPRTRYSYAMLLAFDLDKTLVTDDYRLTDEIADAVIAARGRGHIVTVLTGRPLIAAQEYLARLGIDVPHSVNHGSTILGGDGTVMARRQLDPADVATML